MSKPYRRIKAACGLKKHKTHYPSGFLNFETSTESHKKTRRMQNNGSDIYFQIGQIQMDTQVVRFLT